MSVRAGCSPTPSNADVWGRGSHSLNAEGRKDSVNRPEGPPTGMSESVDILCKHNTQLIPLFLAASLEKENITALLQNKTANNVLEGDVVPEIWRGSRWPV